MNRMLYSQQFGLLVVLSVFLTGCSPYLYKEQVATFDSGVEEASKAYKERARDMDKIAISSKLAITHYPRLTLKIGCDTDTDVCPVVVKDTNQTLPYIERVRESHFVVLKALNSYSEALKEIVNAEDITALKSANEDACNGIGKAIDAANLDVDKGDSALAQGACTVITKFTEIYLDTKRFIVLKHAVNQADPEVEKLSNYLQKKSKTVDTYLKRNVNAAMFDIVNSLPHDFPGDDKEQLKQYNKGLTDALAIYHKNKEVLKTDLAPSFDKLREAHQALVKAVNDPNSQKDAALDTVRDFYKEAKSLTEHDKE